MRLLKEKKQNSCTLRSKTQGFEKKGGGGRLKCTIGKGKIGRCVLNYYIGKSEQPGTREIRVNNAQKKHPRDPRDPRVNVSVNTLLSRYQSPLNEKQTPVEY